MKCRVKHKLQATVFLFFLNARLRMFGKQPMMVIAVVMIRNLAPRFCTCKVLEFSLD